MAEPEPPEPALNIWMRPERAGRGPVPEHSRAEIAAAGVALADAEGLAATTMRRVAAAVGTAPASLYRYLANRDELIALMANAVTAELSLTDLPSGAGWQADILTVAQRLRAHYRRHPWMLDVMQSGAGQALIGPAAVDYLEGMVAALSELEVPARTKLEATAMLTGIAGLFAKDEDAAGGNVSAQAQAANAAYLGTVAADGRHPHLSRVMLQAGAEAAASGGAGVDAADPDALRADRSRRDVRPARRPPHPVTLRISKVEFFSCAA
jgi:AcrR family transcriptional regulator